MMENKIPGSGPKKSDIMVIGSYVTEEEDREGFSYPPQTLMEYLESIELTEEDYYYTNAVKVFRGKDYKIKVSDITKDKPELLKEIETVDPKYILLVGSQALKATVGGSITNLNGTIIEHEEIKYVPTLSPGIVFRDPGKARNVEEALNTFEELINGNEKTLPELDIRIITNKEHADEAIKYIKDKPISYDIETRGLNRFEHDLTLFGFGDNSRQYILPLEVKYSPLQGFKKKQMYLLRHILKGLSDASERIAGNGKFDNLFLKEQFNMKPIITFDVVLASHILNENTPNGVVANAVLECGALDWDINLKLKTGNVETQEDYDEYITYLGYDIYYEYSLYEVFEPRIKSDPALDNLYYHLYMPVIRAYEEIEERGVYVFQEQFQEVKIHLEKAIKDVEERLSPYGHEDTNWASSKQVKEILFEELELPILEKTATGNPSTGESALLQLKDHHPIAELLLEHRGLKIQYSHFIDGWIKRMHNGRLHPSYLLLTVTGRTSCKNPNLQQVPRDPIIRSLIGAPEGYTFVEVDFSQAELRVATILSGDRTMTRIYNEGGDIHSNTYELVTGEKVSDDPRTRTEQRKQAKALNFGFLYGMGWRTFQNYARDSYGMTLNEEESKEYRKNFFKSYSALPKWHEKQRKLVKSQGQVRSPIGRIRRLPDIYSSDRMRKAEAERQSINAPVQGFGSDLTLLGMAEATQYAHVAHDDLKLDKEQFYCVGTVHDATLFEVKNEYLEEFAGKIKEIMEHPKALKEIFNFDSPIPIAVDVSFGQSWGKQEVELDFSGDWRKEVNDYLESL